MARRSRVLHIATIQCDGNMIKCNHWRDCGVNRGGCCSIEEYDRPSWGVCLLSCNKNTHKISRDAAHDILKINKKSQGLGDTIKKIIDKATLGKVKPCGGCKKRQEALNKIMPYKGADNG